MSSILSSICETILAIWILFNLLSAYLAKDKSKVWSPISVISLTYGYYCLVPYWIGTKEQYEINESLYNGYLFHFAALLSFASIMIGFRLSRTKCRFLKSVNSLSRHNAGIIGVFITIIALIFYSSVRGFHISFIDTGNKEELAIGGLVYYAMMTLDMLPFAAGLILIGLKNSKRNILYIVLLWLILVQFLVAGARWRIVVALITMLAVYYLYPKVKQIKLSILLPIAIIIFLGFSAMDQIRSRGVGISIERASSLSFDDIKGGSNENYDVYRFSLLCIDNITKTENYIFFKPIITAILMPIPRSYFPDKPDAIYILDIESKLGLYGGSAYLNFVESYYSFGWIGVILFGWFLGWLARVFWDFYDRNRESTTAIVTLGVFTGFCYVMVSRGYLAASVTSIILAIYVPLWIIRLCNVFFRRWLWK